MRSAANAHCSMNRYIRRRRECERRQGLQISRRKETFWHVNGASTTKMHRLSRSPSYACAMSMLASTNWRNDWTAVNEETASCREATPYHRSRSPVLSAEQGGARGRRTAQGNVQTGDPSVASTRSDSTGVATTAPVRYHCSQWRESTRRRTVVSSARHFQSRTSWRWMIPSSSQRFSDFWIFRKCLPR